MFLSAFLDMHIAFELHSIDGNVVRGINRTTCTRTGDFDLSGKGIDVVLATGKSAMTVFPVSYDIQDGKFVSTKGEPVDIMGFESVLAHLGIELP
jgi:hypothetical protein